MTSPVETFETQEEAAALAGFKSRNQDLFTKNDRELSRHLTILLSVLAFSTLVAVTNPFLPIKILFALFSGFCWFSLINITIHHHLTHRNAAESEEMKKVMDFLYSIAVPNAPKRRTRYTRAHMNHHLRPFHETDVDHHYGTRRYLRMKENPTEKLLYFLELTFVGAHVPGWEDDRYMNQVPLENWNQKDYEAVKEKEKSEAVRTAVIQWGSLIAVLMVSGHLGILGTLLQAVVWGWALPMLLVKNWAHYLGQFQHYEENFLKPQLSIWKKTKSYRGVPAWLNYLCGGELTGHFLHHLYPELPYYKVEAARVRLAADPVMSKLFLIY